MSKEIYNMASECHLRPALKAVLHKLAWHTDANGRNAFPSVETILLHTGYTRRTVQKVLREAEALGIICAVGSRRGGRRRSTRYDFNLSKLQELRRTANRTTSLGAYKSEPETETANAMHQNSEPRTPEYQEHKKEKMATPCQEERAHKQTEQPRTVDQIPGGLDKGRGEQVLSSIREHLKTQVDPHSFDIWLQPLKAIGCADGELCIRLPRPEFREPVERYRNLIEEALTFKEIQDARTVRFV
jgi:hypothetical protein